MAGGIREEFLHDQLQPQHHRPAERELLTTTRDKGMQLTQLGVVCGEGLKLAHSQCDGREWARSLAYPLL